MNGDSAGLEPADRSRKAGSGASRETLRVWRETEEQLETVGEYKAAREVGDAAGRLQSLIEAREASEGERRSQTLHGQNPETPEVDG